MSSRSSSRQSSSSSNNKSNRRSGDYHNSNTSSSRGGGDYYKSSTNNSRSSSSHRDTNNVSSSVRDYHPNNHNHRGSSQHSTSSDQHHHHHRSGSYPRPSSSNSKKRHRSPWDIAFEDWGLNRHYFKLRKQDSDPKCSSSLGVVDYYPTDRKNPEEYFEKYVVKNEGYAERLPLALASTVEETHFQYKSLLNIGMDIVSQRERYDQEKIIQQKSSTSKQRLNLISFLRSNIRSANERHSKGWMDELEMAKRPFNEIIQLGIPQKDWKPTETDPFPLLTFITQHRPALTRATWFIKVNFLYSELNELKADVNDKFGDWSYDHKRFILRSEEWTKQLMSFLLLQRSQSLSSQRSNWIYVIQLAKHQFEAGMLDKNQYFKGWIGLLSSTSSASDSALKKNADTNDDHAVILSMIIHQLPQIFRSGEHTRLLFHTAVKILASMTNASTNNDNKHSQEEEEAAARVNHYIASICEIIRYIILNASDALIRLEPKLPEFPPILFNPQFCLTSPTVNDDNEAEHYRRQYIKKCMQMTQDIQQRIARLQEFYSNSYVPPSQCNEMDVIQVLDQFHEPTLQMEAKTIYSKIFFRARGTSTTESQAVDTSAVFLVCEWAVTDSRSSEFRLSSAVTLLEHHAMALQPTTCHSSLSDDHHQSQYVLVLQDVIQDFIQSFQPQSLKEFQGSIELCARLVVRHLFSVPYFIRHLIASGIIHPSCTTAKNCSQKVPKIDPQCINESDHHVAIDYQLENGPGTGIQEVDLVNLPLANRCLIYLWHLPRGLQPLAAPSFSILSREADNSATATNHHLHSMKHKKKQLYLTRQNQYLYNQWCSMFQTYPPVPKEEEQEQSTLLRAQKLAVNLFCLYDINRNDQDRITRELSRQRLKTELFRLCTSALCIHDRRCFGQFLLNQFFGQPMIRQRMMMGGRRAGNEKSGSENNSHQKGKYFYSTFQPQPGLVLRNQVKKVKESKSSRSKKSKTAKNRTNYDSRYSVQLFQCNAGVGASAEDFVHSMIQLLELVDVSLLLDFLMWCMRHATTYIVRNVIILYIQRYEQAFTSHEFIPSLLQSFIDRFREQHHGDEPASDKASGIENKVDDQVRTIGKYFCEVYYNHKSRQCVDQWDKSIDIPQVLLVEIARSSRRKETSDSSSANTSNNTNLKEVDTLDVTIPIVRIPPFSESPPKNMKQALTNALIALEEECILVEQPLSQRCSRKTRTKKTSMTGTADCRDQGIDRAVKELHPFCTRPNEHIFILRHFLMAMMEKWIASAAKHRQNHAQQPENSDSIPMGTPSLITRCVRVIRELMIQPNPKTSAIEVKEVFCNSLMVWLLREVIPIFSVSSSSTTTSSSNSKFKNPYASTDAGVDEDTHALNRCGQLDMVQCGLRAFLQSLLIHQVISLPQMIRFVLVQGFPQQRKASTKAGSSSLGAQLLTMTLVVELLTDISIPQHTDELERMNYADEQAIHYLQFLRRKLPLSIVFPLILRLCKIAYQMDKSFQLRKREERGTVAAYAFIQLTKDLILRDIILSDSKRCSDAYILPLYQESQWYAAVVLSSLCRPRDEPLEDKVGKVKLRTSEEILNDIVSVWSLHRGAWLLLNLQLEREQYKQKHHKSSSKTSAGVPPPPSNNNNNVIPPLGSSRNPSPVMVIQSHPKTTTSTSHRSSAPCLPPLPPPSPPSPSPPSAKSQSSIIGSSSPLPPPPGTPPVPPPTSSSTPLLLSPPLPSLLSVTTVTHVSSSPPPPPLESSPVLQPAPVPPPSSSSSSGGGGGLAKVSSTVSNTMDDPPPAPHSSSSPLLLAQSSVEEIQPNEMNNNNNNDAEELSYFHTLEFGEAKDASESLAHLVIKQLLKLGHFSTTRGANGTSRSVKQQPPQPPLSSCGGSRLTTPLTVAASFPGGFPSSTLLPSLSPLSLMSPPFNPNAFVNTPGSLTTTQEIQSAGARQSGVQVIPAAQRSKFLFRATSTSNVTQERPQTAMHVHIQPFEGIQKHELDKGGKNTTEEEEEEEERQHIIQQKMMMERHYQHTMAYATLYASVICSISRRAIAATLLELQELLKKDAQKLLLRSSTHRTYEPHHQLKWKPIWILLRGILCHANAHHHHSLFANGLIEQFQLLLDASKTMFIGAYHPSTCSSTSQQQRFVQWQNQLVFRLQCLLLVGPYLHSTSSISSSIHSKPTTTMTTTTNPVAVQDCVSRLTQVLVRLCACTLVQTSPDLFSWILDCLSTFDWKSSNSPKKNPQEALVDLYQAQRRVTLDHPDLQRRLEAVFPPVPALYPHSGSTPVVVEGSREVQDRVVRVSRVQKDNNPSSHFKIKVDPWTCVEHIPDVPSISSLLCRTKKRTRKEMQYYA